MALVLSASKTAKELGIRTEKMLELLKSGDIVAYRDGRNWKVPVKEIEKYVEKRAAIETAERRKEWQQKKKGTA